MSPKEMSNQFDIYFNNIMSNQAPGLDDYDKSVILTRAQNEIVKAYFSPALNKTQNGFDSTPTRQIDFSSIIKNIILNPISATTFDYRAKAFEFPEDVFISLNEQVISGNTQYTVLPISFVQYDTLMTKPYKFPPKNQVWRLLSNNITIGEGNISTVKSNSLDSEISNTVFLQLQSDYSKPVRMVIKSVLESALPQGNPPIIVETRSLITVTCELKVNTESSAYWSRFITNPKYTISQYFKDFDGSQSIFPSFTVPNKEAVLWDLTNPGGAPKLNSTIAEIIGIFDPEKTLTYKIRYIKKLKPIIVSNLHDIDEDLSVEGEYLETASELPEELHEDILQRAVELAKAFYTGDLGNQLALGQNSGTEKGVVAQSR